MGDKQTKREGKTSISVEPLVLRRVRREISNTGRLRRKGFTTVSAVAERGMRLVLAEHGILEPEAEA